MTDYETDFYAWAREQAELVRAGRVNELDLPNLAEELEGLARNERFVVGKHLNKIMRYLIKWQFLPNTRDPEWRSEVMGERFDVRRFLKDSPSLMAELPDLIAYEWKLAINMFTIETELPRDRFPEKCPWTTEQLFDIHFIPD